MGFFSNTVARLLRPKSTGFTDFAPDYMIRKVLRQKMEELLKPYILLKDIKNNGDGRISITGVPRGEHSEITLSAALDIAEDGSRVVFSDIAASREWMQTLLRRLVEQRTFDVPERLTGAALSLKSFLR